MTHKAAHPYELTMARRGRRARAAPSVEAILLSKGAIGELIICLPYSRAIFHHVVELWSHSFLTIALVYAFDMSYVNGIILVREGDLPLFCRKRRLWPKTSRSIVVA